MKHMRLNKYIKAYRVVDYLNKRHLTAEKEKKTNKL